MRQIMIYLPRFTIPFVPPVKIKSLAILPSASASTMILKLWAHLSMGGFNLAFLTVLIIIGLCAAGTI